MTAAGSGDAGAGPDSVGQLHGLLDAAAWRTPDAPALQTGDRVYSYSALSERIWKLAGALRDLGLHPGDRVAGWLPYGGDEIHALLAVSAAGGVYVPVDAQLKAPQMNHVLRDCGARMLVTQGVRLAALARLAGDLPGLRCVLGAGRSATQPLQKAQAVVPVISMSEVRASANPADPTPVRTADDPAVVLYAGAPQGPPVGSPLSHAELVARAGRRAAGLTLQPDDAVLTVVDPSLRPGLELLIASLAAGALLDAPAAGAPIAGPEDLLSHATSTRLTVLAADRSDWIRLLALPWAADAFPDLRLAIICGPPLSPQQTAELTWRLPGVQGKALRRPDYPPGVIVTCGRPVGPDDVAAALLETGLVASADVTPLPDPTAGQLIAATCTLRDLHGAEEAIDADKLLRQIAPSLPPFMLPSRIALLPPTG